jgi:5'-nucleotidase (lipoprotein e(P4) family)
MVGISTNRPLDADMFRPLFAPAGLLTVGLVAGYYLGSTGPVADATQTPLTARPTGLNMQDRLGGNYWLQTSAEYQACCLQTYHLAGRRLEQLLAVPNPPPKPAVVLDLDETVFDNSAFQNALYAANLEYTQDLWDIYEKNDPNEVTLIPGAKAFIDRAEKLGVTVIYISNRGDQFRASTIKALERLGLGTAGIESRLLLKKTVSSDKTGRRAEVESRYNVVLYFGDNLRDFSEVFVAPKVSPSAGPDELRKAIAARQKQADEATAHWGVDWFVLPNPVYGEWDKLAGTDPKAVLPPSKLDLTKAR